MLKSRSSLPIILCFGVVLAALGLLSPGTVQAGEDGFTSPLIIPAAEFESSAVWTYGTLDRFSDTYGYYYAASDELTSIMAPVYLPWGATITKLEASMFDLVSYNPGSTATCPHFYPDVEVELISNHYDDNAYPQDTHTITHAQVSSTINTGQLHIASDTSIVEPYVNNLQQIFWVRVYVCGQFQGFQGVRIHYTE